MLDSDFYDEEYFEDGTKSGYRGYTTSLLTKAELTLISLIRALAIKFLLNPKTLLDVGCANGKMIWFLRKIGVDARGMDISEYIISRANLKIKPYLKNGNITDIPFENSRFDVVTTFDLLEHIPQSHLDKALIECQRISKKYVFHRICTPDTFLHKIFGHPDPSHVSMFSQEWWDKKFENLNIKKGRKFFPKFQNGGWFLLEK